MDKTLLVASFRAAMANCKDQVFASLQRLVRALAEGCLLRVKNVRVKNCSCFLWTAFSTLQVNPLAIHQAKVINCVTQKEREREQNSASK
jgi:hypothetical protein